MSEKDRQIKKKKDNTSYYKKLGKKFKRQRWGWVFFFLKDTKLSLKKNFGIN